MVHFKFGQEKRASSEQRRYSTPSESDLNTAVKEERRKTKAMADCPTCRSKPVAPRRKLQGTDFYDGEHEQCGKGAGEIGLMIAAPAERHCRSESL